MKILKPWETQSCGKCWWFSNLFVISSSAVGFQDISSCMGITYLFTVRLAWQTFNLKWFLERYIYIYEVSLFTIIFFKLQYVRENAIVNIPHFCFFREVQSRAVLYYFIATLSLTHSLWFLLKNLEAMDRPQKSLGKPKNPPTVFFCIVCELCKHRFNVNYWVKLIIE